MRIAFILNGSKRKTLGIPARLKASGLRFHEYSCFTTSGPRDAIRIAFECAPVFDLIVAAGGDGTLHECLNGLMQFKENSPGITVAALTILPIGTGNDFVKNFQGRITLEFIAGPHISTRIRKMDIGKLTSSDQSPRYFINIADAGFGPVAVGYTEKLPKGIPGGLKFGLGILRAFLNYRKKTLRVQSENFNWKGQALMVVLANGRYFGGGVAIAPHSDMFDGQMEIIVIGNVSLFDYIRYLPKLRKGQHIDHPEVHYSRAREVELSGDGGTEMDGEMGYALPVKAEIMPGAIEFLFPGEVIL